MIVENDRGNLMSDPRKPADKYTGGQRNAFKILGISPIADEKEVEKAYAARMQLLNELTESKTIVGDDIKKIKQGLDEAKMMASAEPGTIDSGLISNTEYYDATAEDDMWNPKVKRYGTREVNLAINLFLNRSAPLKDAQTTIQDIPETIAGLKDAQTTIKDIPEKNAIQKLILILEKLQELIKHYKDDPEEKSEPYAPMKLQLLQDITTRLLEKIPADQQNVGRASL